MKIHHLAIALLLALSLTGCGRQTAAPTAQIAPAPQEESTAEAAPDRAPTAEELGRAERMDLAFSVEGETEMVSATLYTGQGYSIYIPDEGWRLEKRVDDGIPEESWESVLNDDVELTVSHYAGKTVTEARDLFLLDEDYVFEDLLGGELGDPLTGVDEDGDHLSFMLAEGAGTVYVISWEYPAEAAEGFGVRLEQIAGTFEVME